MPVFAPDQLQPVKVFRPEELRPSAPGSSPDNPDPSPPPEIGYGDRTSLMYRSRDMKDVAANIQKEKGLEAVATPDDDNVVVKSQDGKYHLLRETYFNWRRLTDKLGEAQDMGAQIAGGAAAGLTGSWTGPGAIAAGAAGAAGAGAASKGLRTGSAEGALEGGVEGLTQELGGRALGWGVGKVAKYAGMGAKAADKGMEFAAESLKAPKALQDLATKADEAKLQSLEAQGMKATIQGTKAEQAAEAARLRGASARAQEATQGLAADRAADVAAEAPARAELKLADSEYTNMRLDLAEKLRGREAALPETIQAGKDIAARDPSVLGAKASTMGTPAPPGIRDALWSTVVPHPGSGVTAATMEAAPEVRAIGRKHFGPAFINEFGSWAMKTRNEFLSWLGRSNPEALTKGAKGWAEDMSAWLLGSGEKFTQETQSVLSKIAHGIPPANEVEAKIFHEALAGKLAKEAETPEIQAAMRRLQEARGLAKGAAAETAANEIGRTDEAAGIAAKRKGIAGEKVALENRKMGTAFQEAGQYVPLKQAAVRAGLDVAKGRLEIPRGVQATGKALEAALGGSLGGLVGGPGGAVVGAAVGASGALARPMEIAGRAVEWLRVRPPALVKASILRLPARLRGAIGSIYDAFTKGSAPAARAAVQSLIQANPDMAEQIENFFR